MKQLIYELCSIDGVSGNEESVASYIKEYVKPYADEMFSDVLGNLYVFKKGKKCDKIIMVTAHMDEVGFIVKQITEDGYLKFAVVGGIDSRVMLGTYVRIGDIKGIIGIKAHHLTTAEERKKMMPVRDMYIDIGAKSWEDAEKYVKIGDYIAFDTYPHDLGKLCTAKALDDRYGCAVMMNLIKEKLENDVWFVFCVQEELGGAGAIAASNRLKPDIALVLETTTAADLPGVKGEKRVCSVGGGAVIPFADRGTIYDEGLREIAMRKADRLSLKHQTKTMVAGATDGSEISVSGEGVRTIAISLASRYLHTGVCTASFEDMNAVLDITRSFINTL
ncbi:MAG: M42 family metallopeptidase [Clostridiales bacterium]|nr:M42 family metallopeptidase [Clostridiales bacterium]